jgi:hypothetical protein
VALPPFDVALEDFALEEDFFVEELDFALDDDFALLLLDFFTALLDTGSSGSALLPLSPPQAVNKNADMAQIANNFLINISLLISRDSRLANRCTTS